MVELESIELRIDIFETAELSFWQIDSQDHKMFVDSVSPIDCFPYSIHRKFDKQPSLFITC